MTHFPLALAAAALLGPGAPPPPGPVDFAREVRPVLASYCLPCHGPDEQARKAGLRLDEREGAVRAGRGGRRAVVPGHPGESELLARLLDGDRPMPPASFGKRPTPAEVETLRRWIAQGATYTRHWSHVPPARPAPPRVAGPGPLRNPIDSFVRDRLAREGLRPAPEADRAVLLRRASIDLTGLPPTVAEVDRFLADPRPDAYERAVDDLLARPAFGERWASVWLDLARYADSAGYTHDPPRAVWRWRDWLIQALNDNTPYDRFTAEVLAGDLLPGATTEQVIATGFHRNTTTNTEGGSSAEEYHFAAVADRVNTTLQVWMGSTFACAQCHTHKYDPFTQKDYYRLFAVFNSTADFNSEEPALRVARPGREAAFREVSALLDRARKRSEEETRRADAGRAAWEKAADRAKLPPEVAAALAVEAPKRTPAQAGLLAGHHRRTSGAWVEAEKELRRLEGEFDRVATTTPVMKEVAPRVTHVALRGEYQNRGERVTPGVPASLHPAPAGEKFDRLALARWLTAPDNPLTARVAVNRLWQELFGVGLVETAEEFGSQGSPPSHPELLDWLATEYVRLGWDTKKLLAVLVTSATYRQASEAGAEDLRRDPANRLLARGPRVRLSAEAVRDQALAAGGLLSPRMFGPPAHPHQPRNGLAAAFGQSTDWESGAGEDARRRAVYTRWRRNLPYPSMLTFDVPERAVCSARRVRTNTPLQALVTLNDPVFVEAAQGLAREILASGGPTPGGRAAHGFRRVAARAPSAAELVRLVRLYQQARASLEKDPARAAELATRPLGPLPPGADALEVAAWTVVGNVLLNLDEVLMKR